MQVGFCMHEKDVEALLLSLGLDISDLAG